MNIKGIVHYLSLFCFPIAILSFVNILYSSYFNYFLSINSYTVTLFISLLLSLVLFFFGKKSNKKINFYEQIILIILVYLLISFLIAIPYYLSNYQIPFINSLFEAFSGLTTTGFSVFENIKYLDPTLILWRSSSQWIGGLYFLIFLVLFFSNSQFKYKLNFLTYDNKDESLNPENNIKKISIKLFFIYLILTSIIFIFFTISGIRLYNGFNLSMTVISLGGFLPTNSLENIVKSNAQQIVLVLAFLVPILNIFLINNLFQVKNILKAHYEDFSILIFIVVFSSILVLLIKDLTALEIMIGVVSSLGNSGISIKAFPENLTLILLLLVIFGGSILSNSSGIKFLRIYILLKASFIEIIKLVKPNNVFKQQILNSNHKIDSEIIKLSFLIFISFFISLFTLSGILLFDDINFNEAFKLSILTITNTASSDLYGLKNIEFSNLLTSSKIAIIIFMIIGKIELISAFLVIKHFFFKN